MEVPEIWAVREKLEGQRLGGGGGGGVCDTGEASTAMKPWDVGNTAVDIDGYLLVERGFSRRVRSRWLSVAEGAQ